MFKSWRINFGFTLLEGLVVSLLASGLVIGSVSFLQVQIKSGILLHEKDRLNDEFQSTFKRLHRSLARLRLPLGEASVELDDQRMTVRYIAGAQTRNCHGTHVLEGSQVIDLFFRAQSVLSCRSTYIDQNASAKQDRQPLLNGVHDFRVNLVHLIEETCIDAIDINITLEASLLSLRHQSYRVVYPKCEAAIERSSFI